MWSVLPIGDTNYYSSTTTAGSSTQQPISFNTVGNFVYFLLPSNNNNGGTVIYNATWNYIYKVNHNAFFINNTIPSSVNQLLPQNASDGSIDFAYTISSESIFRFLSVVDGVVMTWRRCGVRTVLWDSENTQTFFSIKSRLFTGRCLGN